MLARTAMRCLWLLTLTACDTNLINVYDANSGALLWQTRAMGAEPRSAGNTLVGWSGGQALEGLRASDGKVLWQRHNVFGTMLGASDGVAVTMLSADTIAGLDAATGATLWTSSGVMPYAHIDIDSADEATFGTTKFIDIRTGAATAASDLRGTGNCVAQYCGTSAVRWIGHSMSATFVLFADGSITALDATSGAVLWQQAGSWGELRFVQNTLLVSAGDAIAVLDATTGVPVWRVPESNANWSGAIGDGAIFVRVEPQEQRVLTAIDLATGAQRWQANQGYALGVAVYDGAQIYVPSFDQEDALHLQSASQSGASL